MREALAFAVLACACGVAAQTASRPNATSAPTSAATSTLTVETADGGRGFLDLEARWRPVLHGMHVVAERDTTLDRTELVRADVRDLCFRVAFDATDPVVATLVDSAGVTLATSGEAAAGLLASDGPVCIRRGSALDGAAAGPAGARIRWLTWGTRP